MIKGLDVFRQHFSGMTDNFILIGGAACDIQLSKLAIDFRTTRDLDIVLCVESLTADFGRTFWQFIVEGKYQIQERSDGTKRLYRFRRPENHDYPEMLELFARHPEAIIPADESQLTPLPLPEQISSLSAILLDDDYYAFIRSHCETIDGLSVLVPEALLVLKAKAWVDLSDRKQRGEKVDTKDISKHKNDILRLADILYDDTVLELSVLMLNDMKLFMEQFSNENMDVKNLHLQSTEKEIKKRLKHLFRLD